MKKILTTLILFCLASPVFAVQKTTMKVYQELNDTCVPKISTNNNMSDFVICSLNFVENPINWLEGWSTPVKADMYLLFAQLATNDNITYTNAEEIASAPIIRTQLKTGLRQLLDFMRTNGVANSKMTPEVVKKYRGY